MSAGNFQFCVLCYMISHEASTTYIHRIQRVLYARLLMNGKKYSASSPICQLYTERFPFPIQKICLLPLNVRVCVF